jgi:hypothetical protein
MCGSFGGPCAYNHGSIPASTPEEAPFVSERSSLPTLDDRELAHHRRNVRGRVAGRLKVRKPSLALRIVLISIPLPREGLPWAVLCDPIEKVA